MKKNIILFLQLVGIFVMTYIAVAIIPPTAKTEAYRSYVNENISPYKESDKNKYLELLSSFNKYTYQKDELFTIENKDTTSSFKITGYLVASNKNNNNNNGIFIFIDEATYKNEPFLQIALEVYYDKALNNNATSPVKNLEPVFVSSKDGIRGFYISNYYFDDINFSKITSLSFGILTKNHSNEKFLIISDKPEKAYTFNETFTDKNIDLKNVKLSSMISDSTNIPTDNEKTTYNLYYNKFNDNSLNKYLYIYVLFYFIYALILSPIIYFLYLRKPLKERRLKRKYQKSQE